MTESPTDAPAPGVSVVMPVGSIDPHLDGALLALAEQDADERWELVLSLNTADPAARTALEAAAAPVRDRGVEVRVIDSSDVRSAAHARNVGAEAARGERLAFCDGDDLAEPDWLRRLLDGLDDHDAVGGHLAEEKLAIAGQEDWRPPATPGDNPSFLGHPFLVSANMAVRASAFAETGGFDVTLIRGEDIAFSWSLLRNGATLGFVPEAVIHYRHRKGLRPMLHQHYLYGRGMAQLLRRYGTPDGSSGLLSANNQPVVHRSKVHYLRRGAIAVGRVVGIGEGLVERVLTSRAEQPTGVGEGVH